MRLHRFFVEADLSRSTVKIEDRGLCHQLAKVLRLTAGRSRSESPCGELRCGEPRLMAGDRVVLVDGKNTEAEAEIIALNSSLLEAKILSRRALLSEPARAVTLCCSILKRENFELVVQKATEIGVRAIIPVLSDRTVKTGLKLERLQSIAKEAAEQSGRGTLPTISEPVSLAEALDLCKHQKKLFFHVSESKSVSAISNDTVALFIGPEGGWSEQDVAQAKENDCIFASFGTLTLRAETAAIVASYLAVQK